MAISGEEYDRLCGELSAGKSVIVCGRRALNVSELETILYDERRAEEKGIDTQGTGLGFPASMVAGFAELKTADDWWKSGENRLLFAELVADIVVAKLKAIVDEEYPPIGRTEHDIDPRDLPRDSGDKDTESGDAPTEEVKPDATVTPASAPNPMASMTVSTLRDIAKGHNIVNFSRMSKEELLDAIMEKQTEALDEADEADDSDPLHDPSRQLIPG